VARAFIAVGSNIEPAENVRAAVRLLAARVRVEGISTVYQTEPLGRPEQESYYNCVVEVATDLGPRELKWSVLRPIEERLGRVRGEDRYAARTIDLDVIVYGEAAFEEEGLTLPDPEILRRPFLAVPLAELAPGLSLPGLGVTAEEAAERLPREGMRPLDGYTESLRREVVREH